MKIRTVDKYIYIAAIVSLTYYRASNATLDKGMHNKLQIERQLLCIYTVSALECSCPIINLRGAAALSVLYVRLLRLSPHTGHTIHDGEQG